MQCVERTDRDYLLLIRNVPGHIEARAGGGGVLRRLRCSGLCACLVPDGSCEPVGGAGTHQQAKRGQRAVRRPARRPPPPRTV